MNTVFAALTVVSTLNPALVLDIDDDGFSMEPAPAAVGYTVDIDDDGWTRLPIEARSDRGAVLPSDCTQLEATLGVAEAACGTIEANDLVRMKFDADSND